MSNFLNKLFGRTDEDYDYDDYDSYDSYDYEEPYQEESPNIREARSKRERERTVPFPGAKPGTDHTVVLVEAFDIDTAWPVCDHVKQGRTVICSLRSVYPPRCACASRILSRDPPTRSGGFCRLSHSLSLSLLPPRRILTLTMGAWPSARFETRAVSPLCRAS